MLKKSGFNQKNWNFRIVTFSNAYLKKPVLGVEIRHFTLLKDEHEIFKLHRDEKFQKFLQKVEKWQNFCWKSQFFNFCQKNVIVFKKHLIFAK